MSPVRSVRYSHYDSIPTLVGLLPQETQVKLACGHILNTLGDPRIHSPNLLTKNITQIKKAEVHLTGFKRRNGCLKFLTLFFIALGVIFIAFEIFKGALQFNQTRILYGLTLISLIALSLYGCTPFKWNHEELREELDLLLATHGNTMRMCFNATNLPQIETAIQNNGSLHPSQKSVSLVKLREIMQSL